MPPHCLLKTQSYFLATGWLEEAGLLCDQPPHYYQRLTREMLDANRKPRWPSLCLLLPLESQICSLENICRDTSSVPCFVNLYHAMGEKDQKTNGQIDRNAHKTVTHNQIHLVHWHIKTETHARRQSYTKWRHTQLLQRVSLSMNEIYSAFKPGRQWMSILIWIVIRKAMVNIFEFDIYRPMKIEKNYQRNSNQLPDAILSDGLIIY